MEACIIPETTSALIHPVPLKHRLFFLVLTALERPDINNASAGLSLPVVRLYLRYASSALHPCIRSTPARLVAARNPRTSPVDKAAAWRLFPYIFRVRMYRLMLLIFHLQYSNTIHFKLRPATGDNTFFTERAVFMGPSFYLSSTFLKLHIAAPIYSSPAGCNLANAYTF